MSENDQIQIAVLKERVNKWMTTTEDYRKTLCEKIGEIKSGQIRMFEMLYQLPCKERNEIYKGLLLREKLVWGGIGIVFTILAVHLGWR